jgi:RNA polymerase sigma factor (TIGR02999 family)
MDDHAAPTPPSAYLTERFYAELRDIAHRAFADERRGHTLQPTAAVNEACLRLMSTSPLPDLPRTEQLALAARVLSQVLVDHQRRRGASKRGGALVRLDLDDVAGDASEAAVDLDAVQQALARLRELHPRQAEVVTLRVFGGMQMDEIARTLGAGKRTVEGDWTVARAWLRRALSQDGGRDGGQDGGRDP